MSSTAGLLPPFDPALLDRQTADDHWVIVEDDQLTARCSLWWRNTPPYQDHRIGMIGHFAAASAESASALLDHACSQLKSRGCTLAVGPMDGNTWRNYRYITQRGARPTFFLEPDNPDDGPAQFLAHGFEVLATYFSAIAEDLSRSDPRVARARARLIRTGIRIRPLRDETFEFDLRQICSIVAQSFRNHLLFAPIDEAEFLAQFGALRGTVPNELVRIAEQQGQMVGFCFGLPDLLQARIGLPIDTAILKTFGVLPGRQFAGLGQVLLEEFQQQAQSFGFRKVIHALVRDAGHMQRISQRYAVPFRRYALYARELAQ